MRFLRLLAVSFVLSAAVSACSAQHSSTSTTSPTSETHGVLTTQQTCDQQHWPQPVPADLVGKLLGDVLDTSETLCFNFARALAPDGHDVLAGGNGRAAGSAWRIIAVTPPSGTGVNENQPIVLTVAPA